MTVKHLAKFLVCMLCLLIAPAGCDCLRSRQPIPRSFADRNYSRAEVDRYLAMIEKNIAAGKKVAPLFRMDKTFTQFIHLLDLKPTDVVADIGCGAGLLEIMALENALPLQKLYAVDIDRKALQFVSEVIERLPARDKDKILITPSRMNDVSLPVNEIDVAILISFHAFTAKVSPTGLLEIDGKGADCLQTLVHSLKPDGRIEFLFDRENDPDPETAFRRFEHAFQQAGMITTKKEIITAHSEEFYHLTFRVRPEKVQP